MRGEEWSRQSHWWAPGVNTIDRVQPLTFGALHGAGSAAVATLVVSWAQGWLRRIKADGEPQTVDEVLAYARHIERDMPSLAADLRAAALRHETPAA
jgi:hypothetical protein